MSERVLRGVGKKVCLGAPANERACSTQRREESMCLGGISVGAWGVEVLQLLEGVAAAGLPRGSGSIAPGCGNWLHLSWKLPLYLLK